MARHTVEEMDSWAARQAGAEPRRRLPVVQGSGASRSRATRQVTIADALADPGVPKEARGWLAHARSDPEWAVAHNPPSFVKGKEACWDKAKKAARDAGADDLYAFANYWFQENCA